MAAIDLGVLFDDLVRVEIGLWEAVDRRLRADHDLPLTWFEPLRAVADAPGGFRKVNEIASLLSITVGGASKLVERLEHAGLLERRDDPGDRRVSRISLTAAGAGRLHAAERTQADELATRLGAGLGEDDLSDLATILARLRGSGVLVGGHHHDSEVAA